MEKVIITLRAADSGAAFCDALCGPIADDLLGLCLPGLTVNVRDAPVRDSLMSLRTLDPPVQALVSVWTDQHYGDQVTTALQLLRPHADHIAAYLVTESVPLRPPAAPAGQRWPGLANVALLRRPVELPLATWLARWLGDHTGVAIATQSTFGYVQNYVVRALTPDAPAVSAIVEEHFPIEAVASLHAFFGASDDADLADRMGRMIASTAAFGANQNLDTVPTGRYVFRDPFGDPTCG